MKKMFVIASMILIFSSTLVAGDFRHSGLKLGYNSANFSGRDIPGLGTNAQPGIVFGGFVTYQLNNRFSLQQELFFTTKGAKINVVGDAYLSNIFLYFQLPILAKMTLRNDKMIRPFFYIGPALDLKIAATNDVGELDEIRKTDVELLLGGGIELWKIAVDFRFHQGMLNFDVSENDIELKHRVFSVLVGYSF